MNQRIDTGRHTSTFTPQYNTRALRLTKPLLYLVRCIKNRRSRVMGSESNVLIREMPLLSSQGIF